MKVLYTFGGMPHYLNALLNKVVAKGAEVTVVMPDKGNATIGKGVKMVDGGSYKRVPSPENKMWYGKMGFPRLPEIVEAEKPNIVVMGWPYFLQVALQPSLRKALNGSKAKLLIREIPFQTPPYGGIKAYFKANPMIDENMNVLSHGAAFALKQWLIAKIRRRCYSYASGALNYSTAAYDILPSYGLSRDQIHVTYNCTDTAALMQQRSAVLAAEPILPASAHRILHIGRLVKWKRVDLLIDAVAIVAKQVPDVELVVVGNGPESDSLKAQAQRLGVGRNCNFVGAVYDPKTLGAYMHESSVYVLAGMGGLSINDAMTYSMPIICSVCDSTERDLVADGVNGYFFKEGDATDLAAKIEKLLASPELCRKMGEESFKVIRDKINIDTVSDRYMEVYKNLMHRHLHMSQKDRKLHA